MESLLDPLPSGAALPGYDSSLSGLTLSDSAVLESNSPLMNLNRTLQSMGSSLKEPLLLTSAGTELATAPVESYLIGGSTEATLSDLPAPGPITVGNLGQGTRTAPGSNTAADPLLGVAATAQLVGGSAKINFQPAGSPIPSGYTADTGAAYDSTRGFGWVRQDSLSSATHVPLNISPNARDRNSSGVEQRLDTLIHMQYPSTINNSTAVKIPAAWEYALPNGKYSVAVSVGNKDVYDDSTHRIRAEGVEVIRPFKGVTNHQFELGTATVNVSDGKLTIDAIGGTNTKINYLEIASVSSGAHPSATGSSPTSRQSNVALNTAVNVDVALPTTGQGVDSSTLNTTNVRLYRTLDNTLVSGNINTTGGGDAIVYQPTSPLAANTNYSFRINQGVKDQSGVSFLPFSTTFTTGSSTITKTPGVNFAKSTVYTGAPISTLLISPNKGQLYAAGLDGSLRRWNINSSGDLVGEKLFKDGANNPLTGRAIIGMAFNPNISNDLYLWTTNNSPVDPASEPADDFTGKITKISLKNTVSFDGDIQDYIVGLPRSAKDHLSNSLVYGPDEDPGPGYKSYLYMTQGSNSAMGAPDSAWYNRPERLLSGAVLRIDQGQFEQRPPGGFNVQTEPYTNKAGQTVTNPQGYYNPNDSKWNGKAPVQIYASGTRNAYDLVWHSNGKLYVPTNGSAAGGNTPDDPRTTANEALRNVATQNDYLFKVEKGGYYGHPNPKRNEYIMNGGNPTSGKDPAEVIAQGSYAGYPVGTKPDPNYRGFTYDFGRNRSPNGVTEYKSSTFNGALKNQLLVTEYSGGDDLLALKLDTNGNVVGATQAASGFSDPLDVVEDTKNNGNIGTLYVAELPNGGIAGGRITRLRPA